MSSLHLWILIILNQYVYSSSSFNYFLPFILKNAFKFPSSWTSCWLSSFPTWSANQRTYSANQSVAFLEFPQANQRASLVTRRYRHSTVYILLINLYKISRLLLVLTRIRHYITSDTSWTSPFLHVPSLPVITCEFLLF